MKNLGGLREEPLATTRIFPTQPLGGRVTYKSGSWYGLSFVRRGHGGKVKGGSPCNGMSESDIAKGGVASNYHM